MNITLEYEVDCRPRYWPEPHARLYEILSLRSSTYAAHLRRFVACAVEFTAIPYDSSLPTEPFWNNNFFPSLDAIALHGILAEVQPARYLEIGSGNSTKFARHAIRAHSLHTRIISVDREPRAQIDLLCDEVIRESLERVDLSIFDQLQSGDILFIDGSHQCLMNSDVVVSFLDILPRIKPGVWVHFHDIFLPWDYPPEWVQRYYAEEYMLACWLLAESPRIQIELPNYFISRSPELMRELDAIYERLPGLQNRGGGSFWMRMR